MQHKPVLVDESLALLNVKPDSIVVDGTLGSAGHALEILKILGPKGRLIALDQDPQSLERCQSLLKTFSTVSLHHENFVKLDQILDSLNISKVDAVILDVGFSSDQIEDASRGFSFEREGPLDMRMDPRNPISAQDLVNDLSEKELEQMFWEFGQDRFGRKIAKGIVAIRQRNPIRTTLDLANAVEISLFGRIASKGTRPSWARRHPATRVFQALRIAVNRELESLEKGLPAIWTRLKTGGRLVVITFHSLEDRIVKHQFKQWVHDGEALALSKKPIQPNREEIGKNRRSRSAKLRGVEKL